MPTSIKDLKKPWSEYSHASRPPVRPRTIWHVARLNDKQIILACDDNGQFMGEYIPKEVGHIVYGRRHLAITVMLYNNKGQVLLQKRKHKIFDDVWDFGATHPLHLADGKDETFEDAALRCLKREYNIEGIKLSNLGSFNYFAKYKDGLCENEHCVLLIGQYDDKLNVNPEIAYGYKWVDRKDLLFDMNKCPQDYSPWAIACLPLLFRHGFFGNLTQETEELLSVVNKKNEVVGRAKRSEVYEKGLLHRAVNIIVKNPRGQIYLQQRSKNKSSFPLYWDLSCTEHLKPGETFAEAAKRGLKEELGIAAEVKLIRSLHHQYSEFKKNSDLIKENELVELYGARFDGGIQLDKSEVKQGRFLSPEAINKMVNGKDTKFTPWFKNEWDFLNGKRR